MEAHVAQWKKDKVTELVELLQKYSVIGVADMTNMPSPQLQKLRNNLKNVQIIMTKARLIKIAIERLKGNVKGIEELEATMKGMPALLLTNENPFKLAKTLNKSKSSAPAKPGQTAPNDILISAGPTPFAPGPVIGELGALGIKATIQDGKVTIKEDKIIVKEGEVISGPAAAMITRLGIEPMEIGINLLATLEQGIIFTKSVLSVDDAAYMNNLKLAASQAFNLAFNIGYPTKENIVLLLQKAARDAEALAESQDILTSGTVTKMITKAEREAKMIVSKSHTYEPQAPRPSKEGP
ncbi:MAG: 50S ribosomal protein L10 [Candidatus Nanoarchaeia archaeon]